MSPLLASALALVRGWTWLYTSRLDPVSRDDRRAEIESDLWEFHEDARRRGASPAAIAAHMLARLCGGIAHDLLWRRECAEETATLARRSTRLTAAAAAAAAGVAMVWAVFWVSTFVALPPLPDARAVDRVIRAVPAPPPPPPPRPAGLRVPAIFTAPPPPPPPPPLSGIVLTHERYPRTAPPPSR